MILKELLKKEFEDYDNEELYVENLYSSFNAFNIVAYSSNLIKHRKENDNLLVTYKIGVKRSLDSYKERIKSEQDFEKRDVEYNKAVNYYNKKQYKEAYSIFSLLENHRDSKEYLSAIVAQLDKLYNEAVCLYNKSLFRDAFNVFASIDFYLDSQEYIKGCNIQFEEEQKAKEAEARRIREAREAEERRIREAKEAEERRIREAKEAEERRIREAIRAEEEAKQAAQAKRDAIEKKIQAIALHSPVVLAIIFVITYFVIWVKDGVFPNVIVWGIALLVYSIASLILCVKLLKNRWKPSNIKSRICAVIFVIVTIVASVFVFSKLPIDTTSKIVLEANSKTTSTNYGQCVSTIHFDLINNNDYKVTYIYGEMIFYSNSREIAKWDVYFSGDYEPGELHKVTVDFAEKSTCELYETSYENLSITYQITAMKFNDYSGEYKCNGDVMNIK